MSTAPTRTDGLEVGRLPELLDGAEMVAGAAGHQRIATCAVALAGKTPAVMPAGALAVLAWRRSRGSGELAPLRPLIERLAAAGAAALVIAGREGVALPAQARSVADELGLPVIAVTGHSDPLELRRHIEEVLRAASAARDVRSADLNTVLVGALRGGVTPAELIDALARGFAVPAAVSDRYGRVVASAPERAAAELQAAGITDANGWLRGAHDDEPPAQFVPVVHAGHRLGTLVLGAGHELTDAEQAVLDAAASVLALSLHSTDIEGVDKHLEREVLTEILGEDLQVRERATRRATRAGVFPTRAHRVLAIQPVGTTVGQVGMRRLAARLEAEVTARDARSVVIAHEGHIVVLLAASVDADALTRALRRRTPVPLAFGTGPAITDLRRLATAHRQAQRAMLIGQRIRRAGHLAHYEELGAFRLLYLLPEHERQQFVREALGSLAKSTPEAAEWRRTLRVLLECNGNVAEAARRLFLHYNTLRYRIDRLEQLVGPVFTDADHRLAIHVALALHRLDPSD